MEHIKVHPESPQQRLIEQAVDIIKIRDGIAIYPTDTVYGVGCCVSNNKRLKDIAKVLDRDDKRMFSFLCSNLSQAGDYVKISNETYKILKHYLPGPFTFILPSTSFVQKKISTKRKTIGIRVPDHPVTTALLNSLDEPMANMSLNIKGLHRGDPYEFMEPQVINGVDVMIDAGPIEDFGGSTIVDLSGDLPELIRQGKGQWIG